MLIKLSRFCDFFKIYEKKAIVPSGSPETWNLPYLNIVILGQTTLSPYALLINSLSIPPLDKKMVFLAFGMTPDINMYIKIN